MQGPRKTEQSHSRMYMQWSKLQTSRPHLQNHDLQPLPAQACPATSLANHQPIPRYFNVSASGQDREQHEMHNQRPAALSLVQSSVQIFRIPIFSPLLLNCLGQTWAKYLDKHKINTPGALHRIRMSSELKGFQDSNYTVFIFDTHDLSLLYLIWNWNAMNLHCSINKCNLDLVCLSHPFQESPMKHKQRFRNIFANCTSLAKLNSGWVSPISMYEDGR